ncbi:MAG: hypothetical protein JNL81_06920 [Hyphomonadaceae bacterium]|nr:hypothetical protein [Hyphomonadaceae bacterium]
MLELATIIAVSAVALTFLTDASSDTLNAAKAVRRMRGKHQGHRHR